MPDAKPQSSSQSLMSKIPSTRGMLPYLVAAFLASAVMAWYFFVFVPGQLEYFAGLRFRTLAVAAGQVRAKVDNLQLALDGIARNVRDGERPFVDLDLQHIRSYLELLVPDIQLDEKGRTSEGLHIQISSNLSATVGWEGLARQAGVVSKADFDDLLLADTNGKVVWQRERTGPRIGDIKELLNADEPAVGWLPGWHLRTTTPRVDDNKRAPDTVILKSVELNGRAGYLMVQLVGSAAGKSPTKFYLAGLISQKTVQNQAMHIPSEWLVLVTIPLVFLFLALPYVKLVTLTSKERYRFTDVILLAGASIVAAAIGTTLMFAPSWVSQDESLKKFAKDIEEGLKVETQNILVLAKTIQDKKAQIEPHLSNCVIDLPAAHLGRKRCGLWKALPAGGVQPGIVELDVVAWLDRHGKQTQKWSAKRQVTVPAPHTPYAHFHDLTYGHLWTFDDSASSAKFTIDPVRSPTTAELGFIFAVEIANAGKKDTDPFAFVLNVRPQSLIDPVVPPGYGFAILSDDGKVLFHSNQGLSLEENFFEEVGNSALVRGEAEAGRKSLWNGDYHGRPHRLYMQPVTAFVGCPWRIVTFQSMESMLGNQFEQQAGVFRLGLATFLVLALAAFLYWLYLKMQSRELHDTIMAGFVTSRTNSKASIIGCVLLGVLTVFAVAVFRSTYSVNVQDSLTQISVFFVLLPLMGLALTHIARVAAISEGKSTTSSVPVAIELALLILLLGVFPAAGFSRIVYRVNRLEQTELWLQASHDRWQQREKNLQDRTNSPVYGTRTRELLLKGFADPTAKPSPSYLTTIGGVQESIQKDDPKTSAKDSYPFAARAAVEQFLHWSPMAADDELNPLGKYSVINGRLLQYRHTGSDVTLTAPFVGEWLDDLSSWSVAAGLLILIVVFFALFWATKKMASAPPVPLSDLDEQFAAIGDSTFNEGILLVGPPRTVKYRYVREKLNPVDNIPLADTKLSSESIPQIVTRMNRLVASAANGDLSRRIWIHVSNLEAQLMTAESRTLVLRLLEKLMEHKTGQPYKGVVVTSSVDPIAHFKEIFEDERSGIYADAIPEVELSRCSLLLSRFRRCYIPLIQDTDEERVKDLWNKWLMYNPRLWNLVVKAEISHCLPLRDVVPELEAAWAGRKVPLDVLSRAIQSKARAYYELLWSSCTRSEKLVLIQLAQEGFVNPKSCDVVAQLVAKGLITERPSTTIFNYTFREFLRGIERDQVVQEWERMEGSGLWVLAGRLIGSSLAAGGVFYLVTQGLSVQSLLPIISGSGFFGVPIVRELIARITPKPGAATAQSA